MEDYKIYINNEELIEKLEKIHIKKQKLKEKYDIMFGYSPYIVELSGLPRTGKTVTSKRIADFFHEGGFTVGKTIEPAQIIKDTMPMEIVSNMTPLQFNDTTLNISRKQLYELMRHDNDLIIQDRGVIDNYFWYQMLYNEGKISIDRYKKILAKLEDDLLLIDEVYLLTADPKEVVLRDYLNAIYLEERKKTNIERVSLLYKGIMSLLESLPNQDNIKLIDTTNMSEIDLAIDLTDDIMDGMEYKLHNGRRRTKSGFDIK